MLANYKKGGVDMREGMIPTVLGTAVTASGAVMRNKYPAAAWGVMGFGLAHMVLGAIDLVEHRNDFRR
jgi:hypothetical protein